jgi:hypothetical protein
LSISVISIGLATTSELAETNRITFARKLKRKKTLLTNKQFYHLKGGDIMGKKIKTPPTTPKKGVVAKGKKN